jgi:hypothetical protein
MALKTSRMSVSRLRPPARAGGIFGAMITHSSSLLWQPNLGAAMWTEDDRKTHKPRRGRYPSDVIQNHRRFL